LTDPRIVEHRGRIVKTTGDGLLVEFASVVDAVRCAVDVQREMAERNADVPAATRIEFRIGINLGDIIIDGDDIFGDGVNVAARLETLADPGGICVSRVVRDQVRDKLAFGFEDMGEQQVKNIARPVRAHRIVIGDAPSAAAPSAERTVAQPALALPDKPSIAVLPFQNIGGDPEQEYFADVSRFAIAMIAPLLMSCLPGLPIRRQPSSLPIGKMGTLANSDERAKTLASP